MGPKRSGKGKGPAEPEREHQAGTAEPGRQPPGPPDYGHDSVAFIKNERGANLSRSNRFKPGS